MVSAAHSNFLVVCLCAAWCGTCRDYQTGFENLATQYPQVHFQWVDIEDEASGVEDWDIENFPTLLIQHKDSVLFMGPMLPHLQVLKQTLDRYLLLSEAEITDYAHGSPERAAWQTAYNYRSILRHK